MVLIGTTIQSDCYPSTASFKIKIKQPLMDPGLGSVQMSGNRKVKLSTPAGINISSCTNQSGASAGAFIPSELNSGFVTVHPTSFQKIRRNQDDQQSKWQERSQKPLKIPSGHSIIVNNYSIVASRGELARNNNFDEHKNKRKSLQLNGKISSEESRRKSTIIQNSRGSQREATEREAIRTKNSRNKQTSMKKSSSVPANLKELTRRERHHSIRVPEEEGILKRSSSFLAGLASGKQSTTTAAAAATTTSLDRKYGPELQCGATPRPAKAQNTSGIRDDENRLSSALKRYSLSLGVCKKSSSTTTIKDTRGFKDWSNKISSGGKKTVSFSADTSFQDKKTNFQRTAIHEAKVYKKGVLQDRGEEGARTVSPLWETPPGALLRAAREADDEALKKIVTRVEKFGLGDMDVNFTDSSGRTAISYMAGNGASTFLEATLSFSGINPNVPDNEGNTPLHFAAQAGQIDSLNILLQRCPGIEVDTRNKLGFTPLMKAALQGRTKCAKILLFAGANPTLRDHGRGLRAEQWARFCGRYVCAEVIERFSRHRLLEKTTSCRWGSEPELAAKILQGKIAPIPSNPIPPPSTGLRSRIRRVFRTTSGPDRHFSLVTQLTNAALCATSPALPKPGEVPSAVKNLLRPLNLPQLRITLVAPPEVLDKTTDKCLTTFSEKIESNVVKPPRAKKKSK